MKTCRRGLHQYEDALSSCRECQRAAIKRWSVAHRTERRDAARRRRAENIETALVAERRRRENNRDAHRESVRRWVRANPEAHRANTRRWNAAHPLERRASYQRKRAKRKAAPREPFTVAQWNEKVARYGGKCAYCRERPWKHQDHVIPLSRGGSHALANVVPACQPCNQKKHAKVWIPSDVHHYDERLASAYAAAVQAARA